MTRGQMAPNAPVILISEASADWCQAVAQYEACDGRPPVPLHPAPSGTGARIRDHRAGLRNLQSGTSTAWISSSPSIALGQEGRVGTVHHDQGHLGLDRLLGP